jgi:iron only hydrogenase large subunit-like protein
MENRPAGLNIRPRVLYQVARAAWLGQLLERREEICQLLQQEFQDKATRRQVANQIRIAMGLDPHDDDVVLYDHDKEALMGMANEPVVVANPAACANCQAGDRKCESVCAQGAISHDSDGRLVIDYDLCLGEGDCVSACSFGALSEKSQFVPLIDLLRQKTYPVYASLAPAFAGQFGPKVTPGKLRTALQKLGFEDVVETALAADLVTMKEAFEFNDHVQTADDFLITSCCCPVWIKLIENKFPDLLGHISPSVSPMVASARVIKAFTPEAKVVFIGPCVAKKSEALLPDLKGAIDFVLTFQELATVFEAADVDPASMPDEENAQASWAGRVYARTGGVSAAVARTLEKLVPRRAQSFAPLQVDGIPACQQLLEAISKGKPDANFIEGMACKGGCVGGPARILPPEVGAGHVNDYGDASHAPTPVENPHVYAILTRLGYEAEVPALTGEGPVATLLARKLHP